MRRPVLFSALLLMTAAAANAAAAQSASKIITTGSSASRADMTGGVTVESIKGVRLYRGSPALAGRDPASQELSAEREIEIRVVPSKCVWRSLRTQGFYSGTGPKSRRYTQGFYSGN